MNVLMIEPLGDGGLAHYTYNLLNALGRLDVKAGLLTNSKYELAGELTEFDIFARMFRFAHFLIRKFPGLDRETGPFQPLRRIVKLLEYPLNAVEALILARKRRVDLIHFQSVNEIELLMVLLFAMTGHKVVFTIHNVLPRHGSLKWRHLVIYRLLYSLCTHLVVHTEQGKREVRDLFKIEPTKVSVIPHGDYKFFVPESPLSREAAREALQIENDRKAILFFGAIRPNKGLDLLLSALPAVREQVPDVTLMIVGEQCEDYGRYRKMVEEASLGPCVLEKLEYIGNHEVALYFLAADVVVLPYREVTGSGVLQVAYAFGRPVVATGLDGFREVVEHGRNGFLSEPENPRDLAEKVIEILSDPARAEAMGAYSRILCDTRYSWDGVARTTLDVYRRMGEACGCRQ